MNKFIAIGIGTIAAAALAFGCGSSDEGTTASAQVTKAQFVKQAEAVCSQTRNEREHAIAAWQQKTGRTISFDIVLKQILGPLLKQEANELESLAAPQGDEAKLSRMIANLSEGAVAYSQKGTALKSAPAIEAFQKEAEAYGIRACWI